MEPINAAVLVGMMLIFGVEYQCCGADEVVRWGRNKKLPDTLIAYRGEVR
ncbi:MAG: hypothetical protein VB126_02440 [Paludibacter sp.]|nr:hypothetical protein [Paludibacter sp.]